MKVGYEWHSSKMLLFSFVGIREQSRTPSAAPTTREANPAAATEAGGLLTHESKPVQERLFSSQLDTCS